MFSPRRLLSLMIVGLLAIAPAAFAQVTTGNIAGTVTAAGEALPGVTVEAVHVPTGTRYDTVSGANGRFTIPNVRVGGPYRITTTLEGFKPFELADVNVTLGGTSEVEAVMIMTAVSETITVTAATDEIINPNRTGAATTVGEEAIENLPSVNRTIQDFARTNPYFMVDAQDATSTNMTVAGKNNRYNSIQIDGAVNNDLFGLAGTGTPGGQSDAPPISIEAIQEIQMVVSPYDVRQGGFTGGGVNAITRSGTNDFSGSLFYSNRDKSFLGEGPNNNPVREFDAEQYGGRFGGRIIRDRLFFFLTGEHNERGEPNGVSADPAGIFGVNANIAALAQQAKAIAISKYGYDPGSLGDFTESKDNDNLFLRFDSNIGSANQLTLRHNYVKGQRPVVSDRFSTRFRFESAIYDQANETNSTVAQLNTVFSANAYNEARVGLQTIRDQRAIRTEFPSVEIGGTGQRNGDILLGTERFSAANALDQDILEITDDLTLLFGNHTLTVGTHNELFGFKNLFQSEAFGYYYFPTVADFENANPRDYQITVATGDDPLRPAAFDVAQYGFYVSDQWRMRPSLSLTFGLRADKPSFKDTPTYNPIVDTAIGYRTDAVGSEDLVFSPRIGFNWQPGAAGTQQLRGGIGVFAGRTPYVWISNAFAGTGVEQITLTCNKPACTPVFNTDPRNQPTNFAAGGGAFQVALTEDGLELPRVLRATLGYDRDIIWGIKGTIEGVWTRNLEDVYYTNANKVENGTVALDGRPRYSNVSTAISNAHLLTNTDLGEQRLYSVQLNKTFGRNFTVAATYANQNATSAFDGGSSTASSQFNFHHTKDIFNPEESRSAFETKHRLSLATTFNVQSWMLNHSFGFYYNAQSGRPYSLLFGNDINNDGSGTNDLLFVPGGSGLILCPSNGGTPTAAAPCGVAGGNPVAPIANGEARWAAFLESAGLEAGTGEILDRYESFEPWTRTLDFHYELGLPPFRDARANITFDMLNALSMFDSEAGVVRYVPNQNFLPVNFSGIDPTSGKPVYREAGAGRTLPGAQFSTADLRSRWQARMGVRLTF
jgi:hypothetical protein